MSNDKRKETDLDLIKAMEFVLRTGYWSFESVEKADGTVLPPRIVEISSSKDIMFMFKTLLEYTVAKPAAQRTAEDEIKELVLGMSDEQRKQIARLMLSKDETDDKSS